MPSTQTRWSRSVVASLTCFFSLTLTVVGQAGWKAGVARTVITPESEVWMAGYGGRDRPADGKYHDLWIKALALEAEDGTRAVIVSSDTLGIPQSLHRAVTARINKELGISAAAVMLHSSHTHCGPVLRSALYDTYPLQPEHIRAIEEYSAWLEDRLVELVTEAVANLQPATVHLGQTNTDFAVNRRNNLEPEVPRLREAGELKGPVDHAVPVLAVRDSSGKWIAVAFGYACHNTTLSFYQWCGDYAGFAQYELERRHPGMAALFYMGCGADQNPLPRRTVELAKSYGDKLAAAVDGLLGSDQLQAADPELAVALELVPLKLGPVPTTMELEPMAAAKPSYSQRWASRLLGLIKSGHEFPTTYPFPAQVWRIGKRQLWITLGGEVCVDYALGLKKHYGSEIWVAGYCNDVMAYIPSLRVLEEDIPPRASSRWGYEGNTSMMVYGMPCHRWDSSIETSIVESVERLVTQVREGLPDEAAPRIKRIP